ncbi:MAG: RNA polymerase sigma-70 factor [Bacteroidota bacterium]
MAEMEQVQLTQEDSALIRAIIDRDRKVFEVFYKKYYRQLFAVAHRYVGQTETAEEIVHDVFITIWNKAAQLNIQYSMKSYLFRSVVNAALNVVKKEKLDAEQRTAYLSVHDTELGDQLEDHKEGEEAMLKGLEAALEMLPDRCRQVMYLSRFGKLKQKEIAEQMNISIKTVKNHLTYGFQKLREHMENNKKVIIQLLILLTLNAR